MVNISKQYVERMASLMKPSPIAYDILNRHGKGMRPKKSPLTGTMPMGECFKNSFTALQPGQFYCEGYTCHGELKFPMEHAWIMDTDGRVIDPTWKDGTDYFGVAFDEPFLIGVLLETKYHGVFGNLYRLKRTPAELIKLLEGGIAHVG